MSKPTTCMWLHRLACVSFAQRLPLAPAAITISLNMLFEALLPPAGSQQQVDAALEFALEELVSVRPPDPLAFVAATLREFEAGAYGGWALRAKAGEVFALLETFAAVDLDGPALAAAREADELGPLGGALAGEGACSCAEWLLRVYRAAAADEAGSEAALGCIEAQARRLIDEARAAQQRKPAKDGRLLGAAALARSKVLVAVEAPAEAKGKGKAG